MNTYQEKCKKLNEIMAEYARADVAVAFSGGADSSLLLKLAAEQAKEHGTKVTAITANTELHPSGDLEVARKVAQETGANHFILEVKELEQADIRHNPVNRCYRCKTFLFRSVIDMAERYHAKVVMDGTNCDDLLMYRPGLKAVEELGVKSPLREAGFTKADVRALAAEYGISVADRPSAPCLATRFPYGDLLTMERMRTVDQGENYLKTIGLYNVRIRVHGEIARIEVDAEYMEKIIRHKSDITEYLKNLGYKYVTLDLEGFRSGSMDVGLEKE
ncbi:MAG: ATP-dependent sacrificial sulfur transferase LarE [Hespellia sp.]|nr:ATP-dependent sacrificial sulfur transferase LarE [Hespellia sp.]